MRTRLPRPPPRRRRGAESRGGSVRTCGPSCHRRIGAPPHRELDASGDRNTPIYGAAALSGKTASGLSIGALSTVTADETGFYELETIHPGYYTGRTKHIHYLIQHPGYKKLVTQLYFKGDPRNPADPLFRESLAIEIATQKLGGTPVELGHFDIVLSPAATEV